MDKHDRPRKRFLVRSRVVVVVDSVCDASTHADAKDTAAFRAHDIGSRLNIPAALRRTGAQCEPPPGHEGLTDGGYHEGAVLAELASPWLSLELIEDPAWPGRARTMVFAQLQGLDLKHEDLEAIRFRIADIIYDEDAETGVVIVDSQLVAGCVFCVQLDRTIPMALPEHIRSRLTRWPGQGAS